MSDRARLLAIWLGVMSLFAFLLFATDKFKAKRGSWRIPEATLWTAALLGGGAGAFLGMRLFRHKTKKGFFPIGIPVLAFLQLGLLCYVLTCP